VSLGRGWRWPGQDRPVLRPCGWDAAGGQLPIAGFYCFVCGGSSRELSERFFNSSCIFDMIYNATSVVARRWFVNSSFRLSLVISTCSGVSLPIFSPGCLPSSTPASRSFRHSMIWDEWMPCSRRHPPLACGNRNVVSGKVDKFLGRSNRTPTRRTTRSWPLEDVVVHWTIVVYDADRWVGHGKLVPSTRPAIRRTCY